MFRTILRILVVISLVITDIYSVIVYYRNNSSGAYNNGLSAFEESRYTEAFSNLYLVTNKFTISYLPEIKELTQMQFESTFLVNLQEHVKAYDCEEASNILQAYARYFPNSSKISELHQEVTGCYFETAKRSIDNGYLITALIQYQSILARYPNTQAAEQAQDNIATIYMKLAENASINGDEQLALQHLQYLIDHYPNSPQAIQAKSRIIEVREQAGDKARSQGNYDTAIRQYQVILGEAQVTPQISAIGIKISQCYLEWARQARANKDFALAGKLYTTLLQDWNNTSAARGIEEEYIQMTLEYAAYALENGEGDLAIQIFQTTETSYPTTLYGQEAATALPDAYLKYASDLINQKDFPRAIEIYTLYALRYPEREFASTAEEQIDTLYSTYAADKLQQNDFINSYKIYNFLNSFSLNPELRDQAALGYQQAVTALAQDMSGQGKTLFDLAYQQACQHKPTDSPALYLNTNEPGRGLICDTEFEYDLPEDMVANQPGSLRYVVIFTEGKDLLQTCTFSGVYKVYRKRYWWNFEIIDTKTGEKVTQETFYGTNPGTCPTRAAFSVGQFEKTYLGDKPSKSVTDNWLRKWFDR